MKYLILKSMPENIPQNSLFNASDYAESGIYDNGYGWAYVVSKAKNTVYSFECESSFIVDKDPSQGITESTLLKAIAISQRPELAKELD